MCVVFDAITTDLRLNKNYTCFEKDIHIWKHLMFATHAATAKRQKYFDLYPFLLELYDEKHITRMPKGFSRAYDGQKILPTNQDYIDKQLFNLYTTKENKKVYAKHGSYSAKQIEVLSKNFGKNNIKLVKNPTEANIILPKEILPFRQKILHNYLTFKIGSLLFPKGSKIRQYLKSKL